MKMRRFVYEYATYQKDETLKNELMRSDIKKDGINHIINVLRNAERGLITINEAMRELANPFKDEY